MNANFRLAFTQITAQLATVAMCSLGAFLHAYAGLSDEGRIVLRPVGHLTIFAAAVWLFTIVLSAVVVAATRARAVLSWCSLIIATAGLLLLVLR
jgi:hypothetical protein